VVVQHAQLDPEDFTTEMAEIGPDFVPADVPEDIWRKFLADVSVVDRTDFLMWFDRQLQPAYAAQEALAGWEVTLSALRHHALPYIAAQHATLFADQALFRAENLLQQARVLVSDVALRRVRANLLDERARVAHLQSLGQMMTSVLDMQDLQGALSAYLSDVGIRHCHVLIFPEASVATSELQLLLSHVDGVTNFFAAGETFAPAHLLLALLSSGMVGPSAVVMPLLTRLRLLGYMVLDFGSDIGWIYDQVGSEVSSAVFRAQLLAQQQQAQQDVEQLLTEAQRRAALLAGAAEVSQATTSLTNLSVLLPRAVALIRERLGLYYAGIFLVDDARQWAVLRAGTGEAGRIMLARGHKLEIAATSMIGQCVTTREAQITFDAQHEEGQRKNPLLPETRSEMALPLISGDQVIGAMTIQSVAPGAFSQDDITTLQTMAGQLANAIENARLMAQMAQSRRELEIASGQYTARSWREFVERSPQKLGYRYRHVDIEPADAPYIEAQAALQQEASVFTNLVPGEEALSVRSALGVPIRLRNQTLGVLDLRFENADVPQETIELVEQIADRLAISLEGARLLQETRSTAEREQLLSHVTGQMRASLDVDAVLRTAATQIREVMDLSSVTIRLATQTREDA